MLLLMSFSFSNVVDHHDVVILLMFVRDERATRERGEREMRERVKRERRDDERDMRR